MKYTKDKREVIVVRLQDGTRIKINRRATKDKVGFSEMIRRLIAVGLGV